RSSDIPASESASTCQSGLHRDISLLKRVYKASRNGFQRLEDREVYLIIEASTGAGAPTAPDVGRRGFPPFFDIVPPRLIWKKPRGGSDFSKVPLLAIPTCSGPRPLKPAQTQLFFGHSRGLQMCLHAACRNRSTTPEIFCVQHPRGVALERMSSQTSRGVPALCRWRGRSIGLRIRNSSEGGE